MYVCMHVCMYIIYRLYDVHTYIHSLIYVYTYIYMYMSVYLYLLRMCLQASFETVHEFRNQAKSFRVLQAALAEQLPHRSSGLHSIEGLRFLPAP